MVDECVAASVAATPAIDRLRTRMVFAVDGVASAPSGRDELALARRAFRFAEMQAVAVLRLGG